MTNLSPEFRTPYAFETILHASGGGEIARLEAQNRLLETTRPLDHLPPLPEAGRILDVGSGTGYWTLRLASRVPRGQVVCLDRSPELLALARARLEEAGLAAQYLHQDLRELRLEPEAFDLIFTSVTLAHVEELEAVLSHLTAALKPGGWLAGFEPAQGNGRLFELHPPCPALETLVHRMAAVLVEKGSDLGVGLKIAHHLDRLGLEDVTMRSFGEAVHGEHLHTWIQEIFIPLVQTWLAARLDPLELDRLLATALEETAQTYVWADLRRTVILGRKPL